ncbi:hypothetical protein AAG906_039324 [Vitis piasezkii]
MRLILFREFSLEEELLCFSSFTLFDFSQRFLLYAPMLFNNADRLKNQKGLIFTFKQLHSTIGGFGESNVVGHGRFGLVYRGVLHDGGEPKLRKPSLVFSNVLKDRSRETRLPSPQLVHPTPVVSSQEAVKECLIANDKASISISLH